MTLCVSCRSRTRNFAQIVEPETNRFLCYVDATDARVGNWMKYIGCARFYEEQNIVSQQEGTDIFYKAIKVSPAGSQVQNHITSQ